MNCFKTLYTAYRKEDILMKYPVKEINHREPAEITLFITINLPYIEKLEIQINQQKAHFVKLERQVELTILHN